MELREYGAMNDNVNLSSLLSATIDEVQGNRQVILIYLAVMVVSAGIFYVLGLGVASDIFDVSSLATQSYAGLGAAVVIGVSAGLLVYFAATYYLVAGMVRRTTAPGFDALLPFAGIWVLSLIAIFFGFLLIIIPGIILVVRWVALLPVVIARDAPAIDAFSTSWAMSSGRGWSIFGAYVILYMFSLVVSAIGLGFAAVGGPIVASIFDAALTAISGVLYTALSVGAYRLMRDDNEELTQVFE